MENLDMLKPVDSPEDVMQNQHRDRIIANCKRKKKFRSRAAAKSWVILHQSKTGYDFFRNLRIYQCPVCSKWHLATKKK